MRSADVCGSRSSVHGRGVCQNGSASHPPHKTIHHLLLTGLVERDGELVAVDHDDVAVAELLVEHAIADRKLGSRAGRLGDQLALDGERAGAAGAGGAGHAPDGGPVSRARWVIAPARVLVILAFLLLAAARAGGALLRPLPAGRAVARAEMRHVVEARGAVIAAAHPAEAALGFRHLNMGLRQLVEEPRG